MLQVKYKQLRHRLIGVFALAALSCGAVAQTADRTIESEGSDVIAIDVVLDPGQTMIEHAERLNARLRADYPAGFALDAEHTPHISTLQRFVRTADLEKVKVAVGRVVAEMKPTTIRLSAHGYYYIPWEGLGLAGITMAITPELLAFQQKLIDALAPFEVKQGKAAAFVPNADGTPINDPTVAYVNAFVPAHSGKNFLPHVTVGLGHEAFVKKLTTEPFDSFPVKIRAVSIYQLGDFGTARKRLWTTAEPSLRSPGLMLPPGREIDGGSE